jgi:hypothetical protein
MRDLYNAVLRSPRRAEGRLPGSLRSVEIVAYEISGESEFTGITKEQVDRAVRDVTAASQGLNSRTWQVRSTPCRQLPPVIVVGRHHAL